VDGAVKTVHVAAEQKEAMTGVDDADVVAVAVLVPVRHPLVPCNAPAPAARVAQVDTCQFERSVYLRQVRYVRTSLVKLLYTRPRHGCHLTAN